ncbi:MAG: hypothetical protein E6R03_02495 [Hyphomicrobiaceae bacterium]|nr:MAG: hypothetical protein E6R03_02495 [Hyphomicrobiaceae bacterium]
MTKAEQIPFPFFPTELAANDSSGESETSQESTPTLTVCSDDEWDDILENVKERIRFPRGHKVEFRRADQDEGQGMDGWTTKPGRRLFDVAIRREMTYGQTIDTILHELAHVFNWQEHTPWRNDHSPTFWVYLGEVYCAYHQVR